MKPRTATNTELADLAKAAIAASENAHVPYSGFKVGASALCSDGTVIGGCNVESASYGLTICAERNTLHTAIAAGRRDIIALAVVCSDVGAEEARKTPAAVMPCGACRQVMADLLDKTTPILVVNVGVFTVEDLLPNAFTID